MERLGSYEVMITCIVYLSYPFRCVPLTGDITDFINPRCHEYFPRNENYIYIYYGLDVAELYFFLSAYDAILERETDICQQKLLLYVCNYAYVGCNPDTGDPQGICESDCLSLMNEECGDALVSASLTTAFTFVCNDTLQYLRTMDEAHT